MWLQQDLERRHKAALNGETDKQEAARDADLSSHASSMRSNMLPTREVNSSQDPVDQGLGSRIQSSEVLGLGLWALERFGVLFGFRCASSFKPTDVDMHSLPAALGPTCRIEGSTILYISNMQ